MDGMAGYAPSIDIVLEQFLAEQREKLAPRTIARYEEVIELLRHSLNGYAYQSLYGLEKKRWEKAFEDGDEEAFCKLFGPRRSSRTTGSSSATS